MQWLFLSIYIYTVSNNELYVQLLKLMYSFIIIYY